MKMSLFTGQANPSLAAAVAEHLGIPLGDLICERFPDTEEHIEVRESVRGHDVYLIQPTSPPVDAHLLELLLLADACRRAGAVRLTAVMPYFGYARHDRRASGREPVGARLVTDLIRAGGIDRVVALDLHTPAIEGFFSTPLEHLSALTWLADAVRAVLPDNAVVVAPDLGAVKLAEGYARLLDLPVAFVHKTRLTGVEVAVRGIVGDVFHRVPVIVDDMISTGATIEAAARALLVESGAPRIMVVATHALLVGPAIDRLTALPIDRLITTDSVATRLDLPFAAEVVSVAPLLADAITRLHRDQTLHRLLAHR
jgi:ribose-phosphate pyrophosphokinase